MTSLLAVSTLDDSQYWPLLLIGAVLVLVNVATFVIVMSGRGRG